MDILCSLNIKARDSSTDQVLGLLLNGHEFESPQGH
jgi:hypothetical protein